MGLASALSTALTGLTAAETNIDVVGNNLANSQTVGFKESKIAFTTQFLQTLALSSAPTDNTGGTNPRQTGLGTQVAEISPDFTQGTIQSTATPSDVALQGDGFFIVQATSGEPLYTRSGIFKTNADNELVTVNGNRLLGYGVDDEFRLQSTELVPLSIPVGSVRVAQATANVYLEGVFTPTGDVADTAQVIDSAVLGDAAVPRPDASGVVIHAATIPDRELVTAAVTDGGGALSEGALYRYRLAFVDPVGTEGTVSDEISVTVPAGNGLADNTITLQNLPQAPGAYDSLRIYRTEAGGSAYYLLDTIDVSGAGPIDYVDDGSQPLDMSSPLDQTVLNGNYSYLITFAKAGEQESRPSTLIGPVNVANGRIQLSNLPTPPTPEADDGFPAYDRVRIYRNLATDASTFYLVEEVLPGQSYTDSKSDAEIQANGEVDLDGPKISTNTLLINVLSRDELDFEHLFQVGTLKFTGRKGGRLMESQSFEVTEESTVQDLLDFLRCSLGIQRASDDVANPIPNSENHIPGDTSALSPGLSILPEGRIRIVSNNGVDNAIDVGLSAFVLTTETGDVSSPDLGFNAVQEAQGQSTVADFLVYDSLGVPINVRLTAVMEARTDQATTYRWFADSPDNDPLNGVKVAVGTGLVKFDGRGNYVSATNTEVAIDRRHSPAASPLNFNLDFSAISGLAADASSLAASRQDGSTAGTLSAYTINEDGVIRGTFSNGVSRTLGQIRLARFANPAGLEQRGENLFAAGANSGLPVQGNPGENGIATIVAGALELSNTDIGQNLIDLVLASTQYRANTRVISAAQTLLDELLNLRR